MVGANGEAEKAVCHNVLSSCPESSVPRDRRLLVQSSPVSVNGRYVTGCEPMADHTLERNVDKLSQN